MLVLPETTLVLASSSPRRHDLLARLGVPFEIIIPDFEERLERHEQAPAYVARNARGKAEAGIKAFRAQRGAGSILVVGSDTIVVLGDKILEKPIDKQDAESMLSELSGKTHRVYTGLCLIHAPKDGSPATMRGEVVATEVTFRQLTAKEISSYVATGEPMDKAGSYAVQGRSSYMIESIHGSYTNVMGLPLTQVYEWLELFSQQGRLPS